MYDIAIVGGGLAGMSLVLALARLNKKLKIALIDLSDFSTSQDLKLQQKSISHIANTSNQIELPHYVSDLSSTLKSAGRSSAECAEPGSILEVSSSSAGMTRILFESSQNNLDERSLVLNVGSKLFYSHNDISAWESIKPYTTEIKKIIVSEQGKFSKVYLDNSSFDVETLGYVVNFSRFTQVLKERVSDKVNLDLIDFNIFSLFDVKSIDNNSEGYHIVKSADGREVKAKLVLAADGARSKIRELLNIKTDIHNYQQNAIVVNVQHELKNPNIAYERFSEHGPCAILPRHDSDCEYNFSGLVLPYNNNDKYFANISDQELLKYLQKLFGYKLGKFTKLGKRQVFPLYKIASKKLYKNRIILLGSSANNIHPIGGQGFNLGLRDIKIFSDLFFKYHNKLDSSDYNINVINELFEVYSNLRSQDHQKLLSSTHGLLNLFSNDDYKLGVKSNLRSLGMFMANHSYFLRNTIASESMGLYS